MHHSNAHREAQSAFEAQRAEIKSQHAACYIKARDAFDAVKSHPEHPKHDAAKQAFS